MCSGASVLDNLLGNKHNYKNCKRDSDRLIRAYGMAMFDAQSHHNKDVIVKLRKYTEIPYDFTIDIHHEYVFDVYECDSSVCLGNITVCI